MKQYGGMDGGRLACLSGWRAAGPACPAEAARPHRGSHGQPGLAATYAVPGRALEQVEPKPL